MWRTPRLEFSEEFSANYEPSAAYRWESTGWVIPRDSTLQFSFEHYGGASSNARFFSSWIDSNVFYDFGIVGENGAVIRIGSNADDYLPIDVPDGISVSSNVTIFLARLGVPANTLAIASSYYATSSADRIHPFAVHKITVGFDDS